MATGARELREFPVSDITVLPLGPLSASPPPPPPRPFLVLLLLLVLAAVKPEPEQWLSHAAFTQTKRRGLIVQEETVSTARPEELTQTASCQGAGSVQTWFVEKYHPSV